MASLSTVADCLQMFYRMVSTTTSDDALVENGEVADETAYLALTHGFEAAQRFMIARGMTERWRTRSQPIVTWTGTDAVDGGRYVVLSSVIAAGKPFLRFAGLPENSNQGSFVEASGARWGYEVGPDLEYIEGDVYFLRGEQLWIGRGATPPATLYLEYQYRHPEIVAAGTLDFPEDARGLAVAYAARFASMEGWFPRSDPDKLERNVQLWEDAARGVARRTRGPRRMTAPRVIGHRFFA